MENVLSKRIRNLGFIALSVLFLFNCSENKSTNSSEATLDDTDFDTPDWTAETHSKSAEPNFDEVFDDTPTI